MNEPDWPDDTVGFYDDTGTAWCGSHEPKAGDYNGELCPALTRDEEEYPTWLISLGVCAHEKCGSVIADYARDDE